MLTIDQARAKAEELWCKSKFFRGAAWHSISGRRTVGYTDGEFRYAMGWGNTWEEAFEKAAERGFRSDIAG